MEDDVEMEGILQYNGIMLSPLHKALLATLLFGTFGAAGWTFGEQAPQPALLIFYWTLVLNTFFSVRVFTAITPRNMAQTAFDTVLVLTYAVLAFTFNSISLFSATSASLFLVAVLKYLHLRSLVEIEHRLLTRKIILNVSGALLSLIALGTAFAGAEELAAWGLCIVFVLSNVYLLAINPMYRTEQ